MADLPSACVIGAGSSGIAALKALHEAGIPVDCFERSDRVGGNWVFANKNGLSSAYRSLHANTSRDRMQYSDFPMLQSVGAMMPLAEAQGRWIAAYLRGEYRLPAPAVMEADMRREHERMHRRYVASKRHTMEVDFEDYLYRLRREMKAGARRAQAAGFVRPVPARAAVSVDLESV